MSDTGEQCGGPQFGEAMGASEYGGLLVGNWIVPDRGAEVQEGQLGEFIAIVRKKK